MNNDSVPLAAPPRNVRRVLQVAGWNLLFILAGLLLIGIAGEAYFILNTSSSESTSTSLRYNHAPLHFVPEVGYLRIPSSELGFTNRLDFWTVERTNSLGFLDREPIDPIRATESCHITFIGDSFVDAREVPVSDKMQVRLEELAAREAPHLDITTSAFGLENTGQVNQLPFYDRYARRMSPDMVILVFVANDFRVNNSTERYALRPGYVPERLPYGQMALDEDGNIRWFPPAIDFSDAVFTRAYESLNSWHNRAIYRIAGASYFMRWMGFKTKLIKVNDWVYKRFRPMKDSVKRYTEWTRLMDDRGVMFDGWSFTSFALEQFKRRSDSDGFALMVLAVHHVGGEGNPMFERLSAIAESLDIPVVSQHDYILRQGGRVKDADWETDVHWTPAGHQWAAEAVWEHIEEEWRGQCPQVDPRQDVAVGWTYLDGLTDEDQRDYTLYELDEPFSLWNRFHTPDGETQLQTFPASDLEGYRSVYESVKWRRPTMRSGWDVHIYADGLTYLRESCSADDRDIPFFMHVFPKDEGDPPRDIQWIGFEDLVFYFEFRGVEFDGVCMVSIDLPDYEIAGVKTGQKNDDIETWSVYYNFDLPETIDTVNEFRRSGREPEIRSSFEIYIDDGRLLYAKSPCNNEDGEKPFFLYVFPTDENDLAEGREESGFDNLGFKLIDRGGVHDGDCFAAVDLPDYEIESIRTGQIADGVEIWKADYNFALPEILDAVNDLRRSGREPEIRSSFDVYLYDDQLIYVKESCNADDRDMPFFLHVFPADENDLAEGREESGFDNLDFELVQNGGESDDACFAAVNLPEYDIAGIKTGQWVHGEGSVWEASVEFAE